MRHDEVLAKVQEFQNLCTRIAARPNNVDPQELRKRKPQMDAIFEKFDRQFPMMMASAGDSAMGRAYAEACDPVIGEIEDRAENQRMLGPVGPALDAARLHPWVWNAAVNLWDGTHYRNAVQDAYTAVEQQARLKSGVTATGYETWAVFRPAGEEKQVRLRLPDIDRSVDPENWKSAHAGAAFFGEGCASNMRNLAAHSTGEFGEQEALEQLASLSYLARLVDRATVQQPTATA